MCQVLTWVCFKRLSCTVWKFLVFHLTSRRKHLAVDVLKKTIVEKLPNDLEGLESTIERLQGMVETVFRYVDDVVVRATVSLHPQISFLYQGNHVTQEWAGSIISRPYNQ